MLQLVKHVQSKDSRHQQGDGQAHLGGAPAGFFQVFGASLDFTLIQILVASPLVHY